MKKGFFALLLLCSVILSLSIVPALADGDGVLIKLHYNRPDGEYDDWDVWAWDDGKEGAGYPFVEEDGEMVASIPVAAGVAREGFIVRLGGDRWWAKDVDADQFIELSDVTTDTIHIYVESSVEGYTFEKSDATVAASEGEEQEGASIEKDQELSDDLYSFQLKIDGDLYQFPMPYEDLIALGWRCMEEPIQMKENSVWHPEFRKGYLKLDFSLINRGEKTISSEKSLVGGVDITEYKIKDMPETYIELPDGIVYGVSGREDIIAAYGNPTSGSVNDDYLSYKYGTFRTIVFNTRDGVINEVHLTNYVDLENAKAAFSDGSTVTPCKVVEAYNAPEELGVGPLSYVVEFEGDLYQLPAPVDAFLKNGWRIQTEYSDSKVNGGVNSYDYGVISLMRDNRTIRLIVVNYDTVPREVENCFVPKIMVGDSDTEGFKLTISSGITIGMSDEEVHSTLDAIPKDILLKYWVDDSSERFNVYKLKDLDHDNQGITISVNKEEDAVTKIEVYHQPDRLY